MTRLQALLEAVGQALCERARKALTNQSPFGDALPDVAKSAFTYLQKHMPSDEIRHALGEAASARPDDYAKRLAEMIDGLARVQSVPFRAELAEYLAALPFTVRHMFRRPSDPTGRTPPEKIEFYKSENLLVFLPPRRPRYKVGDRPAGLDDWQLTELRGIGECGEVWIGHHAASPDQGPAALKFAIEAETKERVVASQQLFVKAFELNEVNGVVPLRSVYLDTDPPCLESAFVYGYDLSGLMHEWKWRFGDPKPEAAFKLVRRVAEVVGKAHKKKVVHRDLKPSNVLIHPTDGGKFTAWVTDFGWGQIEAVRSLELARGGTPRGEQVRLSHHGAYTPLYASPQQAKREAPDPRDDVYTIGVLWYQLLKRDPHAAAPVGSEWVDDLIPHGFTDAQARVLTACLATRAEKRPHDAAALAELLADPAMSPPGTAAKDDGSRLMSLKSQGSSPRPTVAARGKAADSDAAGRAAAAALGGSAAATSPPPGTLPKLVRNAVGMTFGFVPAGTFEMGGGEVEPGRRPDESPRHVVRLTRPFYLGIFPVTQGQYEKVAGKNPAFFHRANGGGPDLPVESVSWYDAERFCQKLGRVGDEAAFGRAYRLPTEAEWEYACRAGSPAAFPTGDALTDRDGVFGGSAHGHAGPAAVGRKPPNALGLFDTAGNVAEWVADWYDEYYYFDAPGNDPPGPGKGEHKITRGGGWASPAADCRSAARKPLHPDRPNNATGFRVVLMVDGK